MGNIDLGFIRELNILNLSILQMFTVKLKRKGKALSPIFANLLILAIVTVLFIPVFFWTTGLTVETKSFWELSGLIANERIVVEEVNLKGGILSCIIYVRNIGKPAVILEDVFISSDSSTLHKYLKDTDFTTDYVSAVQGDLITITIGNLGFMPAIDETYTIKVYTTRGVGDTYQIIA